jgi:monothiol glutaredoxin
MGIIEGYIDSSIEEQIKSLSSCKECSKFIKDIITENNIALFMKGSKNTPQCGFSKIVVDILIAIKATFIDIDVLQNELLRHEIKMYSQWPTIPQLYIKSRFIGGSDIIRLMYSNGELENLLKNNV